MSQTKPNGDWTVIDHTEDNARAFESRSDAEQAAKTVEELGGEAEVLPPGESPDDAGLDSCDTTPPDDAPTTAPCAICGETVDISEAKSGPERKPIHPDCRDADTARSETETVVVEDVSPTADAESPDAAADLPDRSVADDPLTWMPGEFVDEIDGSPAINRKGFEVLAHFYNFDTYAELEVPPEETDHDYCRVKARAVTDEGRECEAYGSAHVERGDDPELLLEMADTRARKRALSIATGVGAVAVAELKNEVE